MVSSNQNAASLDSMIIITKTLSMITLALEQLKDSQPFNISRVNVERPQCMSMEVVVGTN